MSPHWPSPLVAWILAGWTGALIVGTAVWWWLCRPTRDVRAEEDATVYRFHIHGKLPARSGVNSMFDPGRETRP
jgi:hypothetical protein